mgnify:CR=1 FL=1
MKLYEYKTKAMTLLLNYQPQSPREKELIDRLMIKLNELRTMTLPRLLLDIHLIINHENVSDEFKGLLKKLIPREDEVKEMIVE